MQAGTFTMGDFALFVYFHEFQSELTAFSGLLIASYQQNGVVVEYRQCLWAGGADSEIIA